MTGCCMGWSSRYCIERNECPCDPKTNAETQEALEPCPLCGGEAQYTDNPVLGDKSMALCKNCGCTAYWRKWNRRTLIRDLKKVSDEPVAWRYRLFKETEVWTYTRDKKEAECRLNPNYQVQALFSEKMVP